MKRKTGTPIAFLAGFAFFACAPLSPLVRLSPSAPTTPPTFNDHPAVYLVVEDARSNETLGMLPAPDKTTKPQPAKAVVPVEDIVRQHVIASLTKSGFECLSTPTETSPQLVIQIKRLEFKITTGPTWSELTGNGNLAVNARAGTKTRSKNYTAEEGQKWAFSPPANAHEKYLNLLLTDMLNAFLTDQDFLTFLAKSS